MSVPPPRKLGPPFLLFWGGVTPPPPPPPGGTALTARSKLVHNLDKQCEHNLLTACWQTSYKM
jgi:hypothetical protein